MVREVDGCGIPRLSRGGTSFAQNLGRPGFPMAERLPIALATTYKHLEPSKFSSVFEVIEADEGGTTPKRKVS